MVKTKHILIALAVIGANVLLNMPVHKAFAATPNDNWWYGTTGGFVHTWPNPAVVSGVNLTIDDTTCNIDGEPKHADSVLLDIYGGYTTGNDTVSNNSLTIALNSVQVYAEIYAGYSGNGEASGNKLIINSGTINDPVYGGYSVRGDASGNKLIINSGTINKYVYGGYSYYTGYGPGSGKVSKNEVTINSGTITGEVYGGCSVVDEVSENKLFINNVTIVGNVYGGQTGGDVGVASKNEVTINNGTITGEVYGGYTRAFGDAIGNEVTIKNGTISNGPVSGGYSYMGNVTNNSITIEGGTFNNVTLYGGFCGSGKTSSGNTLNLKTVINGTIKEVAKFQNVNFTIPAGMDREMLMLKVTTISMVLDGVTFNVQNWSDGDYITLVKGVNGTEGALAGHTNFYVLDIGGTKELVYANGTPTARADYTIKQGDVRGDSGITGSYSGSICGNTDGTGLTVAGGSLSDTSYSGNEVLVRRGEYAPAVGNVAVAGAYNTTGDAINNNTVKIYDGTFKGDIYGGNSINGAVSGNKVNIYGGTLGESDTINIYGGWSNVSNATDNLTNIEGGTFASGANIRGGGSNSGNATKNTLSIKGGIFSGASNNFYGGESNTGNVTGNKLNIESGVFSGNDNKFYGGWSNNGGTADKNIVDISGGTFAAGYSLYGGYTTGTSTNNTLNLKTKMGGKAAEVGYFQIMNFTLPTDIANGDTMLKTGTMAFDENGTKINVDVLGKITIAKDIVINLIDVSGEMTGLYGVDKIFGVVATADAGAYSTSVAKIEKSDNIISLTMLEDYVQDVWYTIGSEEKILGSTAPAQTISNADGDVVLYHGAGENNEYDAITTTKSVTVGAETAIGKSFLVSGDLTAAEGVTVAAKNTLNIAADNLKSAVANSGTVNLGAGTLATGSTVTGGTLNINDDVTANASDIAGETNTIAADKTLTLNGGTLADNITGDGNVAIGNGADAAEVTAALTKFGNTGDLTVASNGTLVTGGALNRDFKGTGTVQLNADTNLANGKKIEGTLDGNGKNVTIGTANSIDSFTLDKLTGSTNLTLDVDMCNFTADKIVATDFDGTVVVNGINITKDYAEGASELALPKASTSADEITYLEKSGGNGTTSVKDGQIVVTNKYKYTFTAGGVGKLAYRVDASDLTFKKFMEGTLDSPSPTTLSLTEDLLNLGDGIASISQGPNSITINLNGHNLSSASESNIIVASGKTLNLNGDGTVDGNTNFIVDGDMNITGETAVDGILAGAGTYTNSGTLNIADAGNLQMTNGLTNNDTLNLNGDGTLATGMTISGGTLNVNGNVTANADDIAGNTNTVAKNKTLTFNGGTVAQIISGKGNVAIGDGQNEQTVSADMTKLANEGALAVNTKGTLELTAGAVNRTITNNGIVKLNGATLDGAYVTGGTLEFAVNASYAGSYLTGNVNKVDSGVTLTLTDEKLPANASIENHGTVDLTGGNYDENFVTNAKDSGTVNLNGTAVYQTTAGKVFTVGDATVKTGVSAVRTDEGSTANLLKLVSGTLTLTDEFYSLKYLVSATGVLRIYKYDDTNLSKTKLIMLGTPVEKEISIDDLKSLDENVVLNNVEVTSDKANLIIGSTDTTGDYKNAVAGGFGAGSLNLGAGTEKVTITNGKNLTLGGTDGGTLIKVNGEEKDVTVNVGQGNQSATLNIGNEAVSPDTEYRLPGSVNVAKESAVNVRGKTEITGNLNMAGGEVAVAEGASLNVPEINVTDDAKVSGKVETGKLAGKSGKVITVGNANAAGHVSATTTELNGGTLFLDPVWVNGVGIEGASNFVTGTTTLDGKYIAGQNSVISFGTNDGNDVVNFVNRSNSGIDWSESGITAAVYVAKTVNVTNGAIYVDGSLTEESNPLPNPENGSVTLKDKSLLMVNTRNLTDNTAITGVSTLNTPEQTGKKATIYLRGARTGQDFYITDAGAGEEDRTNLTLAGLGANFEASSSIEDGKLKVHIVKGSLAILDETVMPNVGNALETNGNEEAAAFLDKVSMMTDDVSAIQAVNSVANLGENLGVSRGAYDVANMVGDAIDKHWDNNPSGSVEPPPLTGRHSGDVWAVGTRNKETVDGVELGGMEAQYDAQYNGAVVGVNLSGNFGMAINYTDGKVNNKLGGHNDAEYYGGSLYAKTDWGNLRITADATYTYGKNELSQNGITADAKTETISGGLTLKYMAKAGLNKIGPFAGIRYMHIKGRDYTDSLGINREADKINSVVVPVGLEYTGEFKMAKSTWTFKPVLAVGYLFNLGDRENDMTMRYGGAEDIFGYDFVDDGAFFTHAGMDFAKKNFTLGISYDFMKSKKSKNNRWNVNANVAF